MNQHSNLLKTTVQSFEIEPDINILSQINKKLKLISQLRYEKIQSQQSLIEDQLKEYDNRLEQIEKLENSNERRDVLKEINELSNLKSKIARNYTDLESEINELKVEVGRKTVELQDLKNLNKTSKSVGNNPDSNVLKLKIYRNFGVDIECETNGDDSVLERINEKHRVVVINGRTGVAGSVNVDGLSDYFVSKYVWESL